MKYLRMIFTKWLDSYLKSELVVRLDSAQSELNRAASLISSSELQARRERDSVKSSAQIASASTTATTFHTYLHVLQQGEKANASARSALSILYWCNCRILQVAEPGQTARLLQLYSRNQILLKLSMLARKADLETSLLLLSTLDRMEAERLAGTSTSASSSQAVDASVGIEASLNSNGIQSVLRFLRSREEQARELIADAHSIRLDEIESTDLSLLPLHELQTRLSENDTSRDLRAVQKINRLAYANKLLFLRSADTRLGEDPDILSEYESMRALSRECLVSLIEIYEHLAKRAQLNSELTEAIAALV